MPKRFLPTLLAAALIVAGGIWVATRGDDGTTAERSAAASSPATVSPTSADDSLSAPVETAPTHEPAEAAPAAQPPAKRELAASEWEQELDQGHWVEGRVVFPPDTPLDEKVEVVARGRKFEHGPAHRASVAADGRFRVAFSKKTRSGKLDLEGRYVHLDEPVKVQTPSQDDGPVLLEAQLGGIVRGKIIPPQEVPEAVMQLVGKPIVLQGYADQGIRGWRSGFTHHVELDEELGFEFHAVPAHLRYDLQFDAQIFQPAGVEDFYVDAGKETRLDLEVLQGVSMKGRVVDETGQPSPGVQVSVSVESSGSLGRGRWRNAVSAKDGGFHLQGVSPGTATLKFQRPGTEGGSLEIGQLQRGESREGIEYVLKAGDTISGRVIWPDGTPVVDARIEAEDERSHYRASGVFKTDSLGLFTVTGLESGEYRVTARVTKKTRVKVISRITGKEREKTRRETWRASARHVWGGTGSLALQLSQGLELSGSVVDDVGAAVTDFRVIAGRRVESIAEAGHYTQILDHTSRRVSDPHGAFTLNGFETGLWELRFEAEGHINSSTIPVEVKGSQTLEEVRLVRATRVSGVVLDPGGAPVKGASVESTAGGLTTTPIMTNRGEGMRFGDPRFQRQGESGRDGIFELDQVAPGTMLLHATLPGFARSLPVEITLDPGQIQKNVTLHLRHGARLTGRVLGIDGQGAARRLVEVDQALGSFETTAQTDAEGYFEVGGLDAGRYEVRSPPSETELQTLGLDGTAGAREILGRSAEIELEDGGSAHVLLAAPDVLPVRVFGKVTAGEKERSGQLRLQDDGGDGPSVRGRIGSDGSYELLVPKAGRYDFNLYLDQIEVTMQLTFDVVGPQQQRLDIQIPVARIAGRIFGPEGDPLANITVTGRRRKADDGTSAWSYTSAETDEDGRYSLEDVPTGTWTIEVGGALGRMASDSMLTEAEREVVVSSGANLEGVDLHMDAAGVIKGRVRAANGVPAVEARVFVRDAEGDFIDGYGSTTAEGGGVFTVGGLRPGSYAISAVLGSQTTANDSEVIVVGSATTEIDLRLVAGTLLKIDVVDGNGEPISSRISCLGAGGRDFSTYYDWYGASPSARTERRVGPLPGGTYEVTAWIRNESEKAATITVTVSGEPEREVQLVLE